MDLIERQVAIDAICDNCDAVKASCPHYPCGRYVAVEKLPPAQTEPQWIPVSERLPDNEIYVLISKKPNPILGRKFSVTIAGRFTDMRSRKVGWRDLGFGLIQDEYVTAWMPLPEPYRAERRTDG